jgi:hypothetical protein
MVPKSAVTHFCILDITFSSELQFRSSWTFWKANEMLYSFEVVKIKLKQPNGTRLSSDQDGGTTLLSRERKLGWGHHHL